MEVRMPKKDVDEIMNKAHKLVDEGDSQYPAMSYEEGMIALYDFLFEDGLNPLSDD